MIDQKSLQYYKNCTIHNKECSNSLSVRLIRNKQMNIFIGNKFFVQNSLNDLKLGLTSAPSMLEFDASCWCFYYAIKVQSL